MFVERRHIARISPGRDRRGLHLASSQRETGSAHVRPKRINGARDQGARLG